jgi:oligopeptide transport system permease protein
MKSIGRFLFIRLIISFVTIFLIATVTFMLMKSIPGDPFQDEQGIPEECLQKMRQFYGLEDPLLVQYFRYIQSIFLFDFGFSLKYPAQHVNTIIFESFPISALLGFEALCLAIPLGLILGTLSALFVRRGIDSLTRIFAVLALSIPSFVLAALLQYIFAFRLSLFPIARIGTFAHTVLPALTLSLGPMAMISRLLRASTLETLSQQYIHTAFAKGLKKSRILTIHVLKNACLPVLSYLGPVTTNVLVGSFIVERVFAIPGLGQWFVNGVLNRDYPVIGALTIFYSIILIGVHTVIDLLNTILDPRIMLHARR